MKNFNVRLVQLILILSFWTQLSAQQRPDISTFPPNERLELRQLMMAYITTPVVNKHLLPDPIIGNFHNYREEFLTWHRDYVSDMEAYLLTQPGGDKFVPLPSWNPTTVIPDEFFNALVPPGSSVASGWTFSTITNQDPADVDFTPILNNLCSYMPSAGRTAIDNFAQALEIRHDPVHGNIGGIMGSFQSPAAAIFWLWHAWIDDVYRQYECDCQSIDTNNLYTKDSVEDVGNEANDETTGILYNSSDIWVRNIQDTRLTNGRYSQEDNPLRHQDPEYSALGNPNFVYVKVRNRGCNTIAADVANLRVYWSKASTGLNWPVHFMNYFHSGILHGDEITAAAPIALPVLAPGESYVAEVPWVSPNPADFTFDAQHFCLLSRIESTLDPMTFTEVAAIGTNTRNNNNIAWKNLTIVDLDPFNLVGEGFRAEAVFFVRQTFDSNLPMKLVFKNSDSDIATILKMEPDDKLLELVLKSEDFNEVEVASDQQGSFLELTNLEGSVGGLLLEPDEIYAIRLNFEIACDELSPCIQYGTTANLIIEQYLQNDFGDEFIGGNFYEIRIKQDEETVCGDFPIVDVNIENPSCSNSRDGSIKLELEGTEPYTIFWDNGQSSQLIERLLAREYKVTVRDAENCVNSKTIVLSDESDLALSFEPTHVTRFCDKLGSVNLKVEGGVPDYSVIWSNGSDNFNLQELSTGMYIATVTDANGCERIDSVNINQNFPIRINTKDIKNASNANTNDGEIKISVTGGERPLMYTWNNGANSNEITGLEAGEYIVTITDQLGCTAIDTSIIDLANNVFEQSQNSFLVISPNLVSNKLNIDFSKTLYIGRDAQIDIISIEGRIVNSFRFDSVKREHILNIKDYPTGTYLIKVIVDDQLYVDKFIKK